MFSQLFAIFRNTLLESIRQPIYLVLIAVGILALILNLNLSAFTMDDDNKFLIDMGMATIFLCGLFIAAFIATSVLTREIHNRTVLTVVSKPVGRPLFILGKYLGVSAALLMATVILSCAFLLTVRHQVLQRASDDPDLPVIVFGVGALVLSVGFGAWCNFFYGWVFTSTTVAAMLPLSILAWLAVLAINPEWQPQLFLEEWDGWISPDLDPNKITALVCLSMALLVVAAVAIAASTRLGQVATIFTCIVVFLLGLLSDHFFGRHAFEAEPLARIAEMQPGRDLDDDFADEGDWYRIRLDKALDLEPGQRVYIAADPLGLAMIGSGSSPIAEIRNLDGLQADLVRIGEGPLRRLPRQADHLLAHPPTQRAGYRALWALPPNFQFMVLIDPLTQRHIIPPAYVLLVGAYSALYITAALSVAVVLFQTREVG